MVEEILRVYGCQNLLHEEERVTRYRSGGFHPVELGDILQNGRYTIRHKLGFGGFSTVWVARDHELERWVSIKILVASETGRSRELRNHQALAKLSKHHPGSRYIVKLLDDFLLNGPNGTHQCLVLELVGPTLNISMGEVCTPDDRLDVDDVLQMSKQLLEALDYLHEAGFAYGDLSVKNFTCNFSRLSHVSERKLFKILGAPESLDLVRLDGAPLDDGVPKRLIKSAKWVGWPGEVDRGMDDASVDEGDNEDMSNDDNPDDNLDDEFPAEELRLIDLAEVFYRDDKPDHVSQPSELQAPETILAEPFDHRLDLWSAGMVIYYLCFGGLPFFWLGPRSITSSISSMISFIGDLPEEWSVKIKQMQAEGETGLPELEKIQADTELERSFKDSRNDPELKILYPVIKGLMNFRPSDRISASQALEMIRPLLNAET